MSNWTRTLAICCALALSAPVAMVVAQDGKDGKEAGKYRKTHLTAEERKWARAGDDYPVFDTPFGRIGVMSGYDAVFPETSRCLGIAAADIILWPASLREPFERELLAIPRAEDNRVAVVLANRVDSPYPGGTKSHRKLCI